MCNWADHRRRAIRAGVASVMLVCSVVSVAQTKLGNGSNNNTYGGIGRTATAQEVAAWDIDVRADFAGLPAGRGSVASGMVVWENKCASCHGVFGESIEFFSPLIGGTTAKDIESGRTASLRDNSFPGRSTLMKLSTVSTLWDYIRRAMPWTQPKSLSIDEVYAVTAYLLNLADVVDAGFVLSNNNMAQVQAKLPNRLGMRTDHAMWPDSTFGTPLGSTLGPASGAKAKRAPDVVATACMRDCKSDVRVISSIPEHARDDHGNLALQNRWVGAQFGVRTARDPVMADTAANAGPASTVPTSVQALLSQHHCLSCHGINHKLVGPALTDVAKKHATSSEATTDLAQRISAGSVGQWGAIAMPAQSLPAADALAIARWLTGKL